MKSSDLSPDPGANRTENGHVSRSPFVAADWAGTSTLAPSKDSCGFNGGALDFCNRRNEGDESSASEQVE
jgi:hypothetical protein